MRIPEECTDVRRCHRRRLALRDYRLADNLGATRGAVFLTGTQALVRLLLMQRRLDARRD